MNVLFIGDMFSEDSITFLENNLERIKRENKVNLVIVNAENVSKGKGLSKEDYQRLSKLNITCFTMGNHTFSNSDIKQFIDDSNIIRPLNWDCGIGKGYNLINYNGKTICVINLLGRVYMNQQLDCPFKALDELLENVKADYYIVDMHAEATSEKVALGLDFDGKVDAILGTHTHVQTADERVLPNGTLYITDVGMTGPLDGVIGFEKEKIILRFRKGLYEKAVPQKGRFQFNAVVLELGFKKSIKRLHMES